MPHQDGRDVVPNQPIPRRAGAPASGRHDQSSSWTVKTSAASGHDGTAIRLVARFIAGRDSWRAQREPFETVALLSASDPVDGRADLLRDQLEDLQHLTERVASEVEHHVGEPERLVRGELVHDGLARVGGQGVPQGYADRQRDGLERPARGVRHRAQAVDARGELRWGLRRGVPAIAERHDTPKGARAVPADPDWRMRLLDRLGGEADVVESIELACEAWVVGRPQLLEDAEDLVGLPPASVERRVEDRELLLPPSDAHTADEPPVGQRVDRRQHLRHHDRVTVAEDEDRRADAWPRGRDRGGRKDCDRLEVGRVGREGEASAGVPAGGRSREDHVVAHPERSDLAVLRLSAEGEQRLARRDGALRRQMPPMSIQASKYPLRRVSTPPSHRWRQSTGTKIQWRGLPSSALERCPFPHVSSTRITSPAPIRRVSPSLAVICTPASRLMMYCRRGAGCPSRSYSCWTSRKMIPVAGRRADSRPARLDSVRGTSMSSKCDSPFVST